VIPERVARAACWLAKTATRAAVVGAVGGGVLWWQLRPQSTVAAVVGAVAVLVPSAWLLNVRTALVSFVEMPEKLGEIARRRGGQLRGRPAERQKGGVLEAMRTVRAVVQDYGEVTGSWGLVVQLAAPTFWVFTGLAFLAVPVLVIVALVATAIA
jgi:hypothetical protein